MVSVFSVYVFVVFVILFRRVCVVNSLFGRNVMLFLRLGCKDRWFTFRCFSFFGLLVVGG